MTFMHFSNFRTTKNFDLNRILVTLIVIHYSKQQVTVYEVTVEPGSNAKTLQWKQSNETRIIILHPKTSNFPA